MKSGPGCPPAASAAGLNEDSLTLLIVTSKYRPEVCGVGDYSALLAQRLRGLGHSVDVFTAGDPGAAPEPGVFRCAEWTVPAVHDLAEWIRQQNYSHVLLQYTPTGYSRKGAFPPVALLPRLLRKVCPQCRVITTLHELFYVSNVAELRRIPRNLTVGTAQRLLLAEVAGHSSAVIVTTGERRRFVAGLARVLRWQNQKSLYEIPVGSNIAPVPFSGLERRSLQEKLGLAGKVVLGSFSTSSAPKLLLGALDAVRKSGTDACLLAVGAETAYLQSTGKEYDALAPHIVCTGKVPADEASRLLQLMDVFLLPLADGISARRGTLLAALAHGLPIAGTYGRSSDPWMQASPAFCLAPAGHSAAFFRAVQEVAADPARRDALRQAASALFHRRYTWEAIARDYDCLIGTQK